MRYSNGKGYMTAIGGISIPHVAGTSADSISFRDIEGNEFMMLVRDVMRLNSIIEKHVQEHMTIEEYWEKIK